MDQSKAAVQSSSPGSGRLRRWAGQAFQGLMGALWLPSLLALLILVITFEVQSGGRFLTVNQFNALSSLTAAVAIPGVGVTLLIISGEFDLSVGAMFAFGPILFGTLIADQGWEPSVALVTVLLLAIVIGVVNGLLTTLLGMPSFIVTLGALFGIRGLSIIVTGGFNVLYFGEDPILSVLGGEVGPVPAPLIWTLGITVVMWVVLEWTPYGNWSRAAGSRSGTASALGVPANRVKVINFANSAFLAALGGILQFALFRSVSVGTGQNLELMAIVAAVVGGTALFGVRGTIIGTLIGAAILGVLKTGLIIIGSPGAWFTALIGALLVLSVAANTRFAKLQDRFS